MDGTLSGSIVDGTGEIIITYFEVAVGRGLMATIPVSQ